MITSLLALTPGTRLGVYEVPPPRRADSRHRRDAPRARRRVRDGRAADDVISHRIGIARTTALDGRDRRRGRGDDRTRPSRRAASATNAAPRAGRDAELVTPATDRPTDFALSPDGRQIVFVASGDGPSRLWGRSLATTTAQPLEGTDGRGHHPRRAAEPPVSVVSARWPALPVLRTRSAGHRGATWGHRGLQWTWNIRVRPFGPRAIGRTYWCASTRAMKSVYFLPVRDAGKGRILAADESPEWRRTTSRTSLWRAVRKAPGMATEMQSVCFARCGRPME